MNMPWKVSLNKFKNEMAIQTNLITRYIELLCLLFSYYIEGGILFNFRQLGPCCLVGSRRIIIFFNQQFYSDTKQSPLWWEFLTKWTGRTGGKLTRTQRRKFQWLHITRSPNGCKEKTKPYSKWGKWEVNLNR